jgi:ribosomal protein S18 acetylase RimI-like enzyme
MLTSQRIRLREFEPDHDISIVQKLDTSIVSNITYTMRVEEDSLHLQPRKIKTPYTKKFLIDFKQKDWDQSYVALEDEAVRGFIATAYNAWNRRLVIWHFYVDYPFRRHGIGRLMMEHAINHGRRLGAENAWIETSNFNYPGVQAYRRLGFTLCGGDLTLYKGTESSNEFAVFMTRSLSD